MSCPDDTTTKQHDWNVEDDHGYEVEDMDDREYIAQRYDDSKCPSAGEAQHSQVESDTADLVEQNFESEESLGDGSSFEEEEDEHTKSNEPVVATPQLDLSFSKSDNMNEVIDLNDDTRSSGASDTNTPVSGIKRRPSMASPIPSSSRHSGNIDAYKITDEEFESLQNFDWSRIKSEILGDLEFIITLPQEPALDYESLGPTLPPIAEHLVGSKTLFLDLDETLAHTSLDFSGNDRSPDLIFESETDGAVANVYFRPWLTEFLHVMSQYYELVIYTASLKPYADLILDELDPNHLISHRLYRDHCTQYGQSEIFFKDLHGTGRRLEDSVVVDNRLISFGLNIENSIFVSSYVGDEYDTELLQLIPLLIAISKHADVRPALNETYKLKAIVQKFREASNQEGVTTPGARDEITDRGSNESSNYNNDAPNPSHEFVQMLLQVDNPQAKRDGSVSPGPFATASPVSLASVVESLGESDAHLQAARYSVHAQAVARLGDKGRSRSRSRVNGSQKGTVQKENNRKPAISQSEDDETWEAHYDQYEQDSSTQYSSKGRSMEDSKVVTSTIYEDSLKNNDSEPGENSVEQNKPEFYKIGDDVNGNELKKRGYQQRPDAKTSVDPSGMIGANSGDESASVVRVLSIDNKDYLANEDRERSAVSVVESTKRSEGEQTEKLGASATSDKNKNASAKPNLPPLLMTRHLSRVHKTRKSPAWGASPAAGNAIPLGSGTALSEASKLPSCGSADTSSSSESLSKHLVDSQKIEQQNGKQTSWSRHMMALKCLSMDGHDRQKSSQSIKMSNQDEKDVPAMKILHGSTAEILNNLDEADHRRLDPSQLPSYISAQDPKSDFISNQRSEIHAVARRSTTKTNPVSVPCLNLSGITSTSPSISCTIGSLLACPVKTPDNCQIRSASVMMPQGVNSLQRDGSISQRSQGGMASPLTQTPQWGGIANWNNIQQGYIFSRNETSLNNQPGTFTAPWTIAAAEPRQQPFPTHLASPRPVAPFRPIDVSVQSSTQQWAITPRDEHYNLSPRYTAAASSSYTTPPNSYRAKRPETNVQPSSPFSSFSLPQRSQFSTNQVGTSYGMAMNSTSQGTPKLQHSFQPSVSARMNNSGCMTDRTDELSSYYYRPAQRDVRDRVCSQTSRPGSGHNEAAGPKPFVFIDSDLAYGANRFTTGGVRQGEVRFPATLTMSQANGVARQSTVTGTVLNSTVVNQGLASNVQRYCVNGSTGVPSSDHLFQRTQYQPVYRPEINMNASGSVMYKQQPLVRNDQWPPSMSSSTRLR